MVAWGWGGALVSQTWRLHPKRRFCLHPVKHRISESLQQSLHLRLQLSLFAIGSPLHWDLCNAWTLLVPISCICPYTANGIGALRDVRSCATVTDLGRRGTAVLLKGRLAQCHRTRLVSQMLPEGCLLLKGSASVLTGNEPVLSDRPRGP